jgi:peptidoglycan/xylan/chitin deacetylase (PgdA/CDA1 family)
MSFIKSLAVAALATTVFAHPQHNHAKRNEPYGSIISKCTVAGTVALTFDDGPYIYTDTLLDKLAAVGFKATFFQNGNNWASIYNYNSTLKRMITDGHQIASHTWDHKDLATLTSAQVTAEMSQLEVAYMNILGYYPYYMRPPFLSTNAQALTVLADMNYVVVEVDIDTQDWQNLQVSQEPYSFSNYTAGYAAGGRLSLSHDPYDTTVNGYIPG